MARRIREGAYWTPGEEIELVYRLESKGAKSSKFRAAELPPRRRSPTEIVVVIPAEGWVTVNQAAASLGVSRVTVFRWIKVKALAPDMREGVTMVGVAQLRKLAIERGLFLVQRPRGES